MSKFLQVVATIRFVSDDDGLHANSYRVFVAPRVGFGAVRESLWPAPFAGQRSKEPSKRRPNLVLVSSYLF